MKTKTVNQSKRTRGERIVVGRVKAARENAAVTAAVSAVLSVMDKNEISKPDLAKKLGTTVPNVYQLLDPSRNMTVRTFARVAAALGHSVQISLIAA